MVASYLQDEGYRVIPVHPKATEILGQTVYRSLLEIPERVDVVDVFRPAAEVDSLVDQAIQIGAKAIWTQLRILNFEAMQRAHDAGLLAVVDKCIKMEHARFRGRLHWAGMNTEVVSARRMRA
jgi:predicted CoA-binding protein